MGGDGRGRSGRSGLLRARSLDAGVCAARRALVPEQPSCPAAAVTIPTAAIARSAAPFELRIASSLPDLRRGGPPN